MPKHAALLTRTVAGAVAGLLLVIAHPAAAAEARPAACATEAALADGKPPCCFSNPGYSGVCQVKPAEQETCASILAYLNTALSTGKSYCSNTDIRGGWQQVACEKEKALNGQGRAQPSLYSTILR